MADQQNTQQDRTKPPTTSDLELLPRWARVAFASRCARRVQPLFLEQWTEKSSKQVAGVDHLVEMVEESARLGRSDFSISTASIAAANVDAKVAFYAATDPAIAAITAANSVAAFASGFAAGSADYKDNEAAADAEAVAASAARAVVNRCMWFDFDLLAELARLNAWTDESPVDPDLCGVLWPFGKPEGWPENTDARTDSPLLQIDLLVPADMTDEQSSDFDQRVKEFLASLSRLHAEMGGTGLRILDDGCIRIEPAADETPYRATSTPELIGGAR